MVNRLKVPEEWKEAISKAKGAKISLVIGETDAGKSTLVKFLHSQLGGSIIDSDVGQSDIGPPAVVALSEDGKELSDGYFVGSTTPSGHFLEMIVGTKRMAERANFPVFVDTTGMVHGPPARVLKTQKIESLQPDLLILLGDGLGYYRGFESVGMDVINLPVSKHVEPRSREKRRNARRKAFRSYFSNSEVKTIDLSEVGLERTILGSGVDVTEEVFRILNVQVGRSEKFGDRLILVTEGQINPKIRRMVKEDLSVGRVDVVRESDFKNLLVGLVGRENNFLGIGILENLNFDSLQAEVIMPMGVARRIRSVQFGSIKVRRDGEELGFVSIPR